MFIVLASRVSAGDGVLRLRYKKGKFVWQRGGSSPQSPPPGYATDLYTFSSTLATVHMHVTTEWQRLGPDRAR